MVLEKFREEQHLKRAVLVWVFQKMDKDGKLKRMQCFLALKPSVWPQK